MKQLGLFLVIVLFASFVEKEDEYFQHPQLTREDPESEIIWNSGVKLKWNDFQGKPDSQSSYKAMTTTSIRSSVNEFNDSVVDYNFICSFDKKKSWKKMETTNLLKHEQLHFDIAELATRKLRKEFSEYRFTSLKGVNAHIKKVFANAVAVRKKMGQDYDSETKHGVVEEKQREWEGEITEELKKLDAYADSRVVIRKIKK